MVPDNFRNSKPDWDGVERRSKPMGSNDEQMNSAITEIKVMGERFISLDKTVSAFICEMKEFRTASVHQARQDYEYLDGKIDKKTAEAECIAREALKKVDDHLLISKSDDKHKRGAAEWVRWIFPSLVGIGMFILAIINKVAGGPK